MKRDARGGRAGEGALWLVLLAVAVRLSVILTALAIHGDTAPFLTADSPRYLELGASLQRGAYASVDGPETDRPPALPLLVAVASVAGQPVLATVAANALLGGLTTLLVLVAARRVAGADAGWWAGLLTAVEPGLVLWSAFVLTETLATTAVAALVAALVRYAVLPNRRGWLLVAVACAAGAAYTRTVAYFLPLVIALVPLIVHGPRRRAFAHAGAAIAVAVLLVGAWHVRNGVVTGYWGFSTQMSRAAIYGTAAGVHVVSGDSDIDDVRRERAASLGAEVLDYAGDRGRSGAMLRAAWRTVVDDPDAFAVLTARGLASNLLSPVAFQWLSLFGHPEARGPQPPTASKAFVRSGRQGLVAVWAQVSTTRKMAALWLVTVLLAYYIAAIAGVVRLEPRSLRWILLAVFLYFIVLASGPYASGRFRAPVMPVVTLLAGVGVASRSRHALS